MKVSFIAFALFFVTMSARAALPPARFIASELVKNSGNGIYQVEQDVQFATSGEPLVLRETWWIENENTMRLQVTGLRELKDQFHLQYIYQNGQRIGNSAQGKMAKKVTEDFVEKYFHYRSSERLLNDLIGLKILPPAALQRRTWKSSKEIEYRPESFVRFARTGGSISYAFGVPAPVEGTEPPGLWVEQDNFVLRKLRLPSQVEVIAEKYVPSSKGLMFPRARTIRVGANTIQIQTLSVVSRTGLKPDFFQSSSLNQVNRMDGLENPALKAAVEDFYLRLR